MPTGKDPTPPEQPAQPEQERKPDEPKPVEETPSSHETSGQFPADEVAATHEKNEPKK